MLLIYCAVGLYPLKLDRKVYKHVDYIHTAALYSNAKRLAACTTSTFLHYKFHYLKYKRVPVRKHHSAKAYEGISKSFRTGRLERELQMVQFLPIGAVVSLFCESV
jgi:hypothetical protein